MAKFRIQPHARLQEWVAEEKGYFADEGLDYEFIFGRLLGPNPESTVQPAGMASEVSPSEIKNGAFESYQEGRAAEVSCACHWAVNQASTMGYGRMWGHAYSVTPSGIYVPPGSPIRRAEDLAGVEIGVGYHSGSHFSALQSLERFLKPEEINLSFLGGPNDRLGLLLDGKVQAGNVFSTQAYVVEQQGFRKIVDTSFMIGFMFAEDADVDQVAAYFRALRRAQQDIDHDLPRYRRYFLKELPERYHDLVDVHAFGPGERLVFEPYTREMYESTQRWMTSNDLFSEDLRKAPAYERAVLG